MSSTLPFSVELSIVPDVEETLKKFWDFDHVILFDSVRRDERLGRYSFLSASPIEISTLTTAEFGVDPFRDVREWSKNFAAESDSSLPPFQGGFAGILSYELGSCWERLPQPQIDEFKIPACVIGCYDWVIAWDHVDHRCWVIAHGFPETTAAGREAKAEATCKAIQNHILKDQTLPALKAAPLSEQSRRLQTEQNSIDPDCEIFSNFSKTDYLAAVQRVVDYIYAGDIFQANLSQRLTHQTNRTDLDLYFALRKHNPAPFAGYFRSKDWSVLSSSPERFLQKTGQQLSTRPIKGTRQRWNNPEADLFTRDELRESRKDQAENVMIVDLLRNDLSRVCRPGTIRVPELCSIETYQTVTHLVSEVTGQLQAGNSFWDALQATFPGGSITGAPKIRAMEIIAELEQVARGPYCGSMFYYGFDGTADSNILIRTLTRRGTNLTFPVGGGIVAQSLSVAEYEETLHKSAGIRSSLRSVLPSEL